MGTTSDGLQPNRNGLHHTSDVIFWLSVYGSSSLSFPPVQEAPPVAPALLSLRLMGWKHIQLTRTQIVEEG